MLKLCQKYYSSATALRRGNVRKCGDMGENRRNFSGWFGGLLRMRLLKFIKIYIDISAVGITVSTAFFLTFQGFRGYIDTPERRWV